MIESSGIKIIGSVFDPRKPKDRNVYIRGKLYRVYIYVSGKNVPYISDVTYHLHETFKNNVITVKRTIENPNCVLSIWTWGLFEVKAVVKDKQGHSKTYRHQLAWDKELTDNTKYIPVE